jgi:hypothetical protein
MLAFSKEPKRGVSSPRLKTETDPISESSFCLANYNSGSSTQSTTPVVLSIMHHRESTYIQLNSSTAKYAVLQYFSII